MSKEKWKVEIEEILTRIIDVEAESKSEAIRFVKEKYNNGEIVLISEDFVDNSFTVLPS